MSIVLPLLHFGTIAIALGLPALGVSLGEALIGRAIIKALDRQPHVRQELLRTLFVGMALTETAAILSLTLALILLLGENPQAGSLYTRIAELGIACAIGLPGFVIGLASAQPAIEALHAIARQPFFARNITNLMLLTQSIGQTGIIFGFIIALVIKASMPVVTNMSSALRLLASGIAIGLGSMGPALGLGYFARIACRSLGYNRQAYNKILGFTLVSEAIIETPIIFALLIALVLATTASRSTSVAEGIAFLCAGLVIGIGTFSPGINSGRVAASACTQISLHPEAYSTLSRLSLIGQTLIDTSALYALLTAILIILFRYRLFS